MQDKMADLLDEDEYFEKWYTDSKLGDIRGQISNEFDHKKNWSKFLDENVRNDNESLLN